jgi:hypothetical protein
VRVVLDANLIIERDWHLRTGTAEALLAAAQRRRLRLVIPEVVVREAVAAHAERRTNAQSRLRSALADLHRLDGPNAEDASAKSGSFIQRTYESSLRERLRDHGVEVAPVPEISESLVDRAVRRRRPFDANGKAGFRDALIWQTVLDEASDAQVTVFATDNIKDFGNETKDGLHPHLVEDVAGKGLGSASIRLVRSLDDAARLALEPARDILDRIRARLTDEPGWSNELLELMRQEVASEWPGIDDTGVYVSIETGGEPFEGDIVDSELEDLTLTGPALASDAFPLTEEVYAVTLEAPADATYQLEVSTTAFYHQPHRVPEGLVLSSDERVAYFGGFSRVRALFDGRYNTATGELTGLSVVGLVDE